MLVVVDDTLTSVSRCVLFTFFCYFGASFLFISGSSYIGTTYLLVEMCLNLRTTRVNVANLAFVILKIGFKNSFGRDLILDEQKSFISCSLDNQLYHLPIRVSFARVGVALRERDAGSGVASPVHAGRAAAARRSGRHRRGKH